MSMDPICDDLLAETADLARVLAPLSQADWHMATPAEGWSIRDTIAHLAFFDGTATLAATDADAFAASTKAVFSRSEPMSAATEAAGARNGAAMLDWFNGEREAMVKVFRRLDAKARIPWYGPAMAATSFATARLMETWAHGQDVVDAVGAARPSTDRLRHVAHIGVRARPFSYVTNGRTMPEGEVRVELESPTGGAAWVWNEHETDNVVSGPALDFCLMVTQRRHVADTELVVRGPRAEDWVPIAQAFAGGPGGGRQPGQFPKR